MSRVPKPAPESVLRLLALLGDDDELVTAAFKGAIMARPIDEIDMRRFILAGLAQLEVEMLERSDLRNRGAGTAECRRLLARGRRGV